MPTLSPVMLGYWAGRFKEPREHNPYMRHSRRWWEWTKGYTDGLRFEKDYSYKPAWDRR